MSENPYAAPRAEVRDARAHDPAPALWNPDAAAKWSLLFSPLFGACLHMLNWRALGDDARAAANRQWMIGVAVFFVLLIALSVVLPESKSADLLGRFGGLAVLLTWYFTLGKTQTAHVRERFGDQYPRKSWLLPLAAGVAGVMALFVLALVIGFAVGFLSASA